VATADCTNWVDRPEMPTNRKEERRADLRYPLVAEIEYRIGHGGGRAETGCGKTINISRKTVFFQPMEPVLVGTQIEVSIPWPARLDGTVPLSLVVTGITVHARDEGVALRILRYEFHTRRRIQRSP
jgi:PilZ domain-containing protein